METKPFSVAVAQGWRNATWCILPSSMLQRKWQGWNVWALGSSTSPCAERLPVGVREALGTIPALLRHPLSCKIRNCPSAEMIWKFLWPWKLYLRYTSELWCLNGSRSSFVAEQYTMLASAIGRPRHALNFEHFVSLFYLISATLVGLIDRWKLWIIMPICLNKYAFKALNEKQFTKNLSLDLSLREGCRLHGSARTPVAVC